MTNELDPVPATELEQQVSTLLDDTRRLGSIVRELGGSVEGAEQRFADEIATTLATLEFDLRAAQASFDAERAHTADDLRSTVDGLEDAVRARIDDLAVQARLARMEVKDRLGAVSQRAAQVTAEVRRAADRLADTAGSDFDDLRTATVTGIGDVRRILGEAAAAIRS
jgi:hypothetical protein